MDQPSKDCGYCEEPIIGSGYTYMWFPDRQAMLPVHTYHLTYKGSPSNA